MIEYILTFSKGGGGGGGGGSTKGEGVEQNASLIFFLICIGLLEPQ